MGLSLYQSKKCVASWSYSGFHDFRTRLAATLGFDLKKMVGFGGRVSWGTVSSPLRHLIDHSDCDGELLPTPAMGRALKKIALTWSVDDMGAAYDRRQALALAKAMTRKNAATIKFC